MYHRTMKTGKFLVGLSALVLMISGCAGTSSPDGPTQVDENPAVADTRCDEANQTADQWGSRMKYLNERYDKITAEDPTDENFAEVITEVNDISSEKNTLTQQILYIIVDNPQCFSPADVAWARSLLDS